MTLSKIKILSKLCIFGMIFVLFSCEKDLYEEQLNSSNYKKTFYNLKQLNKVKPEIANKIVIFNSKQEYNSKLVHDHINGFKFDTERMLLIEDNNNYWLTTTIIRDTLIPNMPLENICFTALENGSFFPSIIKYYISEEEKLMIKNNIETPNALNNSSILPLLNYNPSIYNNIFNRATIGEPDYSGTIWQDADGNCYTYDKILRDENGYYIGYTIIQVDCSGYTASSNLAEEGTTSSGNSFIYGFDYLLDDGPGGTTNTNTGSTTGTIGLTGNNIQIISSPVNVNILEDGQTPPNNPCNKLKQLSNNIKNTKALNNLKTKVNEPKEYGYYITKPFEEPKICEATPSNPNVIVMPNGGNIIGAFHTHPPSELGCYPMFSDQDINWLFWTAELHNNNGNPKEYDDYFLTLTVPEGTFCIKIKDIAKFNAFRNNRKFFQNLNSSGTKATSRKLNDRYDKIGLEGNFNKLTNTFLDFLKSGDAGCGLYQLNNNNQWEELELPADYSNNPSNPPIKKPCN